MDRLKQMWMDRFEGHINDDWWNQKTEVYQRRGYDVLKIQGKGSLYRKLAIPKRAPYYEYYLHISILLKKDDHFYLEELTTPFSFEVQDGAIVNHQAIEKRAAADGALQAVARDNLRTQQERFSYDPKEAVKYAERWWNRYNPDYRQFNVDCTNYVSQCLFAGGAPMRGAPDRDAGWWYQDDDWSFSWSVAHAMRWYLSGSTKGLKGSEVDSADELKPGDVICYDFEGDDRWDHNTIVVAKDRDGMPLVNAHTDNSRMRYWSYEDSLAWTPEIAYKFFRIGE